MREEVVNNYLLWESAKLCIRSLVIHPCVSQSKIKRIIKNIRSGVKSNVLAFDDKLNLVRSFSPHSDRVNLFANSSWTRKNHLICDLGTVLPECGDLPPNIITQSLSDVVEYVKKRLDEPHNEKSVKYIHNLMKIPEILTMFPPIVIKPGNLQRNIKVMEKHYHTRNWNIYPALGYIEDGNHRAIAMTILRNQKSISCYVGRY